MATDMNQLQGEIMGNPAAPALRDKEDAAVERLIIGLLRALLDEQGYRPVTRASGDRP